MGIPELTAPLDLSPAAYIVRTSHGGLRIAGTRVGLESVVYAWRGGESPEQIVANYPTLSVEQVHGALAFYFRNREAIDEYLRELERLFEELRQRSMEDEPEVVRRLKALKASGSVASGQRQP